MPANASNQADISRPPAAFAPAATSTSSSGSRIPAAVVNPGGTVSNAAHAQLPSHASFRQRSTAADAQLSTPADLGEQSAAAHAQLPSHASLRQPPAAAHAHLSNHASIYQRSAAADAAGPDSSQHSVSKLGHSASSSKSHGLLPHEYWEADAQHKRLGTTENSAADRLSSVSSNSSGQGLLGSDPAAAAAAGDGAANLAWQEPGHSGGVQQRRTLLRFAAPQQDRLQPFAHTMQQTATDDKLVAEYHDQSAASSGADAKRSVMPANKFQDAPPGPEVAAALVQRQAMQRNMSSKLQHETHASRRSHAASSGDHQHASALLQQKTAAAQQIAFAATRDDEGIRSPQSMRAVHDSLPHNTTHATAVLSQLPAGSGGSLRHAPSQLAGLRLPPNLAQNPGLSIDLTPVRYKSYFPGAGIRPSSEAFAEPPMHRTSDSSSSADGATILRSSTVQDTVRSATSRRKP